MRIRASSSGSSRVASTGTRPMNSGMRPNFKRSSGSTPFKMSPVRRSSTDSTFAPKPTEADRPPRGGRDDLLETGKGAAANEQDVGCVDLQELLLRVLAATLRGHGSDRPFHDLEQGLLHALARHVAGDRRIVGFATNFVDLIDIDDAAL